MLFLIGRGKKELYGGANWLSRLISLLVLFPYCCSSLGYPWGQRSTPSFVHNPCPWWCARDHRNCCCPMMWWLERSWWFMPKVPKWCFVNTLSCVSHPRTSTILQFMAFFCPMSTISIVEALHFLGIWLLQPKCIYLGFICPLWVFYLCLPPEVLLHIGLVRGFLCCTTWEEGVSLKSLSDFSYFH